MKSIVFPAENEQHYGTIIMVPFRGDIWRENAKYMRKYILDLAMIIAEFEKVFLIYDKRCEFDIDNVKHENVKLISLPYDDIWSRDICPSFVYYDDKLTCINWKFNAWGGRKEGAYFPWDDDNAFAHKLANYFNLPVINAPIVLEGGAIITDGAGTIYTTRSVLLNRNRNPFCSKKYIEKIIKDLLGVKKIVWLRRGLYLDETNGHIDNVLSVISPNEICIAWTDDKKNPNYRIVREIYDILKLEFDGIIHKVILPTPQYMLKVESKNLIEFETSLSRNEGDLLPASYLNFYYCNGGLILPSFNCPEDQIVLEQFKKIFPNRKIVQVYSREPLLGGGGIHCILHEIPMRKE